MLNKELEAVRQALGLREKDLTNVKNHVKRAEEEISKLEKNLDEHKAKLVKKDQRAVEMLN